MEEEHIEWPESFSERERDLANLLANRMNDAAHTSSTFFKMKQAYENKQWWMDATVVFLAGLLTFGAVWEQVPNYINFGLAITTALVSFFSTHIDFNRKAIESEKAGDAYNSMVKEFQSYYYLILKDDDYGFDEKKQRLDQLCRKYQNVNNNTIATDDDAYNKVNQGEVMQNLETTESELKMLLSDHNLKQE